MSTYVFLVNVISVVGLRTTRPLPPPVQIAGLVLGLSAYRCYRSGPGLHHLPRGGVPPSHLAPLGYPLLQHADHTRPRHTGQFPLPLPLASLCAQEGSRIPSPLSQSGHHAAPCSSSPCRHPPHHPARRLPSFPSPLSPLPVG